MGDDRVIGYLDKTVIQQYKSDVGFRTLVDSVNDNMYVIPKYQRKYRWSREKVVGLVESLLRGLPIPPIYTCRNKENQLEILDGQQRVMSLFFYYIGYFLNARENSAINFSELEIGDLSFKEALMNQFKLEKLHIELEGDSGAKINVDYHDLPVEVKRRVDYTTITVIEIKIDQGINKEEVLRTTFANLNKGGVLLSEQEQRNGVYNCEFYDMLQDFNRKNDKWRKIWGRENSKEKDLEMLLRFCALKKYVTVEKGKKQNFVINGYNSSYTKMLDRFSEESMSFTKDEIKNYRDSLNKFVEQFAFDTKFSSKVALLESLFVIYEKKNMHNIITKEICDEILNYKKYKENSRQGTVDMKKMNGRWQAVYEILSRFDSGDNE